MKKSKLPSWAKYLLIPVAIYIGYKIYLLMKTANSTAAGIVSSISNSATTGVINQAVINAGLSPIRTQACIEIAEEIYNAFYKYYGGFAEDEIAAMDAFKGLQSNQEAIACATIYKANFKKSLSGDIIKYCHNNDFEGVKTSHLNAIKGI